MRENADCSLRKDDIRQHNRKRPGPILLTYIIPMLESSRVALRATCPGAGGAA